MSPNSFNFNDIEEIILKYVDHCETHHTQTEDGYILKFFRIPQKNPKEVILLQHSIFFDAKLWVSQFNDSVAFVFWRAGYDVWLGNTRGNRYCRKHQTLDSSDPKFWDFSFHEMGHYDNHAIIEYIKRETKKSQIIYMGLSLGSTTGLVYAATRATCAKSVKMMVLLAPVTHMNKGSTWAKYFVPPCVALVHFFKIDQRRTIFQPDAWYVKGFKFFSMRCPKLANFCISLCSGFSDKELDFDLFTAAIKVCGSEQPLKLWLHSNQIYESGGKFRFFDYREKNVKVYGREQPPSYPLSKIEIPVLQVCGEKDVLQCLEDQNKLFQVLCEKSSLNKKMMVIPGFSHIDFTVHSERNERVYDEILRVIEKFNSTGFL